MWRNAKKKKQTVVKSKFSQIKDKKFYFPDGIVSLPLSDLSLKELDHFKQKKGQRIERYFSEEREVVRN